MRRSLLKKSGDNVMTIIDYAIANNLPMLMRCAKQSDVNRVGVYKLGVLHWAVAKANIEMINFWTSFDDCNVNLQSDLGNTPLHLCVGWAGNIPEESRLQMITIFMKAGADVTIKNNNGQTPLSIFLGDGVIKNHILSLMFEGHEVTMAFLCSLNDARTEAQEYKDMSALGYDYERQESFLLQGLLTLDDDNMCQDILKYII